MAVTGASALGGCGDGSGGTTGGSGGAGRTAIGTGGTSGGAGGATGGRSELGGTGGVTSGGTAGTDAGGTTAAGGGGMATGGGGGGDGSAGAATSDGGGADGTSPGTFVHPGIVVNKGMLDYVKANITSEPYKSALAKAAASPQGSKEYTPRPRATVECGPYSQPDNGCTDETRDAAAAYTHALLWYYSGDVAHANKAIEILNAWSSTVQQHTNSNAPLQAAWTAEVFPRAAEILRYSNAGWSEEDAIRFGTMLKDVYLPRVIEGSPNNGNWELSMIEAVINIGIYNDDVPTFEKGISMWRQRTPAYLYLQADGPAPVPPPRGSRTGAALTAFWYDQETLVDGLCQETCRDLGHVQYGLAALVNSGQTAGIQGIDVLGEEATRITAAMEFHAQFLNGAAVPGWLCGGTLDVVAAYPTWEVAYNAYANVRGTSLPRSLAVVQRQRPSGMDRHMAWETLTHGDIGAAGL